MPGYRSGTVAARYLYGDSEPFPFGADFLAALRRFVEASSRALLALHEADELERSLGERAQERLHAIDALSGFFGGLVDVVAERAARSASPQSVGPYANQLIEHIEAMNAAARQHIAQDLDHDQVDVTSRIREKRAASRQALGDYLLAEPLPVSEWALSLELAGTQQTGQAVLTHPSDIETCFALEIGRDPSWSRPRKAGELVAGLALQVGFKKAFLRSSLHPDIVALDELVVSGLELGPDSAEVRLRRRLDAPRDAFVITLDPDDAGRPVARVARLDERSGGAEAPFASQGDDVAHIVELVSALRREAKSLLGYKRRLVWAQLDGHDVFERGLTATLFDRLAERLAPIAEEVERRSPSRNELSLKYERDDCRREELYLRKSDLQAMVAGLPPELLVTYTHLAFLPENLRARSVTPPSAPEPYPSAPPPAPARPSAAPPPPKRKW